MLWWNRDTDSVLNSSVTLLKYVVSLNLQSVKLLWLWDLTPSVKCLNVGERFVTDSVGFFIVLDCASLVRSVEKGNISQIHKDFQHFPENFIKIPNSYAIKT